MQQYNQLVMSILLNGYRESSRSGETISLFGTRLEFDLADEFPIVKSKYTNFDAVVKELLWFLRGETNINTLGARIWDEWATEDGDLGKIYGAQWRSWGSEGIDQIKILVDNLKSIPLSRRHLVTAWNPSDLPDERISPQANVKNGKQALASCHPFFQCYIRDGKLSLQIYQRSADVGLGLPFNIASYALLTHLLAATCGYQVGRLIWVGGDTHIYGDHEAGLRQMLNHPGRYSRTQLVVWPKDNIFGYTSEDINLVGYQHGGKIKLPISV